MEGQDDTSVLGDTFLNNGENGLLLILIANAGVGQFDVTIALGGLLGLNDPDGAAGRLEGGAGELEKLGEKLRRFEAL